MAWPKGQPRKKPIEFIEVDSTPVPPVTKPKSVKEWAMKAGNNWESMTEQSENPDRFGLRRDQ